jgi:hypothetical protein
MQYITIHLVDIQVKLFEIRLEWCLVPNGVRDNDLKKLLRVYIDSDARSRMQPAHKIYNYIYHQDTKVTILEYLGDLLFSEIAPSVRSFLKCNTPRSNEI